ncbi:DNA topology modulation protein [Bacillus spongiae]|uniref:DNA topology modulation protein n=1 Tax=Bacillus spongiae TaxID=2683610 RepID=A0ABU8HDS1_9BACI
MKKIALIGSGGSGKSTLATELGNKLNINVFHLDQLLWNPNWAATSYEEQRQIQNELLSESSWIIDGNYNRTMDIRLEAADTIIFLDISRYICVSRVFKRKLKYHNRTRPDMREGCIEKFDLKFLKWVWDYPKTKKPNVLNKLNQLKKEKEIIILKTPKEIKQFLQNV